MQAHGPGKISHRQSRKPNNNEKKKSLNFDMGSMIVVAGRSVQTALATEETTIAAAGCSQGGSRGAETTSGLWKLDKAGGCEVSATSNYSPKKPKENP